MNDDLEMYIDSSGTYLESIIKSRQFLRNTDTKEQLRKLDELINVELDLALQAANKAKSEILKLAKDNIRPIK